MEPLDEEFERLAAELGERVKASMAAEAESIGSAEPLDVIVPEGHVVLYGFEGTVDAIMLVPDPLPDVLKLQRRPRVADFDAQTPKSILPTAEYLRMGDFTYVRTR